MSRECHHTLFGELRVAKLGHPTVTAGVQRNVLTKPHGAAGFRGGDHAA
jgi:hypothetical protein